ncbi:CitB family two-component system sensor histidine kinase MalK [Mesobacillus foraminis]|uniref:histidine kinase n=1 Tax=Mesobacillus foraminis TaxID=279826 RepID=A0A4R2BJW7_9BACI|nr:CitB family two-component system sensor histidine kinase MalK [Mesobacillus foraminis]
MGAVAVGISLKEVDRALAHSQRNFLTGTFIGLIVGGLGAVLLARYLKRTLLGLEPIAIARIFEERSIMLQSVHEGIVAVDLDLKITLVNKSAIQLFRKAGLSMSPIGKNLHDYMPSAGLEKVLTTGEMRLDEEQRINGLSILVNHVPLVVKGQVVGVISTFRDKTEVNLLAEQLTGVKAYAEALRAQSHEFMNRLHVILGMVKMEMYEELSQFIHGIVDHRKREMTEITSSIKDPALAGFMMGKLSFAREENVDMSVVSETVIPEPEDPLITHELITIMGNLIDNAIEAMYVVKERKLKVHLNYAAGRLSVSVKDSGQGILGGPMGKIFEKGFSTKGQNRGYGLYLVSKSIETLDGTSQIESTASGGTLFTVVIPYIPKGGVK